MGSETGREGSTIVSSSPLGSSGEGEAQNTPRSYPTMGSNSQLLHLPQACHWEGCGTSVIPLRDSEQGAQSGKGRGDVVGMPFEGVGGLGAWILATRTVLSVCQVLSCYVIPKM